jgi:hypothetical protein
MRKSIILTFILLAIPAMAFAANGSGRAVVASAGTANALSATNTLVDTITVCAESDNTGVIAVGKTPVAALATRAGVYLNAGDCYSTSDRQNLTTIKIDATVTGDGVTYEWYAN